MRIQSAFEQAGIVILDGDAGGGIGVRLSGLFRAQPRNVAMCH